MRKLLYLLVVVSVVSLATGYYLYQMPPKNLSRVKTEVTVSADELMSSFEDNEDAANKVYLGKVVEVTGKITDVEIKDDGSAQLILASQSMMGGISCNFSAEDISEFAGVVRKGQNATIKGKCSGYLMDVILERCVVIKLIE